MNLEPPPEAAAAVGGGVDNVFCAGGEGSGVDPSCPAGAGGGGPSLLGKLWNALSMPLGGKPSPSSGDKKLFGPELSKMRSDSTVSHVRTVKEQLKTLGVKDMFKTDLSKSPELRAQGVLKPDLFHKQMNVIEDGLKQAMHFGGDTKAMGDKLKEINDLRAQVKDFHAKYQPEKIEEQLDKLQILPEHFGVKGAGKINVGIAMAHLGKGNNVKDTVKHLMEHGGVLEKTAQRYVREAAKRAKEHLDDVLSKAA